MQSLESGEVNSKYIQVHTFSSKLSACILPHMLLKFAIFAHKSRSDSREKQTFFICSFHNPKNSSGANKIACCTVAYIYF